MKKTPQKPYFSHDADARNNPKIIAMRKKFHAEGYAWYFMTLEILRLRKDHKIPFEPDYHLTAYCEDIDVDKTKYLEWIDDCVKMFHLFKKDKSGFWSNGFLGRMELMNEEREKKSKAGKISAQRRYHPSVLDEIEQRYNTDVTLLQQCSNDDTTLSNKERKKEKKLEKYKEKITSAYTPIHIQVRVHVCPKCKTELVDKYRCHKCNWKKED
jgi:predicted RNA-binding Zn-ribbon protein involved in translation (DUF1610 family)